MATLSVLVIMFPGAMSRHHMLVFMVHQYLRSVQIESSVESTLFQVPIHYAIIMGNMVRHHIASIHLAS